jgi:predicted naringenin-chalcone synthase
LSNIISIGTAVPQFRHNQIDIAHFMQRVYAMSETEKRKLRFLYHQSGIEYRYSVINDYSENIKNWQFYPQSENLEPFPSLELRMKWYQKYAATLSACAIRKCIANKVRLEEITHFITVSCTGMSAPGLDLELMEMLNLPRNIFRTSINFMGCYAAIHALKIADAICQAEKKSKVLIVCTELCSLHFQRGATIDNITSTLLFADGSAAALITSDENAVNKVSLKHFYSEVVPKGKQDMVWELSSTGFLMTLSSYIPDFIEQDFEKLTAKTLSQSGLSLQDITHWCIHPGGKKILEAITRSLHLKANELSYSYNVLKEYGNMSSPTILFVLDKMMKTLDYERPNKIFGAAFGPGLTMETFIGQT